MFSTFVGLALIATAEPEEAESQEEAKTEAAAEEKAEDKRICRRIDVGMGSRKKERVCMTREQWREFNRGN